MNATDEPELDEIAAFLAVVANESFSKAALRLETPKSTISRRVARLEDRLGVRLLQRTTRKLSLTDVGRQYHKRIAAAAQAMREASNEVRKTQEEPRGHLRGTAPPESAELLSSVLIPFTQRYPQVTVEIEIGTRVVDMVGEGFDFALRAGPGLEDSSLVARLIGGTHHHLYASPSYLRAHGTPRSAAELQQHDCVLFRESGGRGNWKLKGPRGEERVTVTGRLSVNQFAFLHQLVRSGAGIGMLPDALCQEDLESRRLAVVLPEYEAGYGVLYLAYPSVSLMSAGMRALKDFLNKELPGRFGARSPSLNRNRKPRS